MGLFEMKLTNTQQLLIRACKSLEAEKRLISVYKRFYYRGATEKETKKNLIIILSRVFEMIVEPDILDDIISELSPNNIKWTLFDRNDYVYEDVVLQYMISKIRLTEVSKIAGFRKPLCFRNKA
jgi:hypothetical protein